MGVREYLDGGEAHDRWIRDYRSGENEAFFELAFDWALPRLGAAPGEPVHDLGCGSAQHTIRLARRGHPVIALDASREALARARETIAARGLGDRVVLRAADLTRLDLADGSVRRGVCWGVLMHIPHPERAVAELSRVLAPDGRLLVSESSRFAPENVALAALKRVLRRGTLPRSVPAGLEYWTPGPLVTRQADPGWLVRAFAEHGLRLRHRRAGQLTELYTRVSAPPLRRALHGLNRWWFRRVGWTAPAYGRLFVFSRD